MGTRVGTFVGVGVGDRVGTGVGDNVGADVGIGVGDLVGAGEGAGVGAGVGVTGEIGKVGLGVGRGKYGNTADRTHDGISLLGACTPQSIAN